MKLPLIQPLTPVRGWHRIAVMLACCTVLGWTCAFANGQSRFGSPDALAAPAPGETAAPSANLADNLATDLDALGTTPPGDSESGPVGEQGVQANTDQTAEAGAADEAGDAEDPADEKATAASSAPTDGSLLTSVASAGVMMFAIMGCSVMLVMFIFERAINLRKSRVIPKHFVQRFLSELEEAQLKPEEALEFCAEHPSPIADVFAAAVRKWNRPAVEVEQAVLDAGERVANGLRRYLRLFNGIATVSPLLGLLGTVLGMIRAFNAIATSDAMGKPELLAEGISQALLTTAGGLSVAIPAFIAYMYFTGRVDRLIIEIDELGQEVVTALASDSWKAEPAKKGKRAKAA